MNEASKDASLERACEKIEGLDIHHDQKAKAKFFQIAIDYASDELKQKGIELLQVATLSDLHSYCELCLKQHPNIDNQMALIVITHAIELTAQDIARRKAT